MKQKNAPQDAHSRDWKMSQATALGARVRKRTHCSSFLAEAKGAQRNSLSISKRKDR